MEITRKPTTVKGPAETFTGDVWVDVVYTGQEPSRVRVNLVRFSPGARSAWHSHALGQTLVVTEGLGLVQSRGESAVEIRAGDVVRTPADEEHWHGAAPQHFMTHLSVTEGTGDPQVAEVSWGPHVTDGEYEAGV